VTKDDTTIVEGGGSAEDVKGRVAQIKRAIDDTDSDWDREKLQERLAKLAGGVAVVKVGAATEVELKEKKHRIEDALSATRAAVEEGIVAGGGTALVRSRKSVRPWPTRWRATRPPVPASWPRPLGAACAGSPSTPASRVPSWSTRWSRQGPHRPQRRHRRNRGPGQGRRHRPGQGDPFGTAERGLHRRSAPHHRGLVADKPEPVRECQQGHIHRKSPSEQRFSTKLGPTTCDSNGLPGSTLELTVPPGLLNS
jgi:hypothetical protein